MVDSCGTCPDCLDHQQQFCDHTVFTYNSPDPHTGKMTYGGYSNHIVVDQRFVLRVSDSLDPSAVAPLLCAGITTYSPLRRWNIGPGDKVGIVGLGGLGHMGIKLAHAFGAQVVLFTTSPHKAEDGKRLGADEVVISTQPDDMQTHLQSFNFILDTVAAPHDLDPYLNLLKRDGTLCLVGMPERPHPAINVGSLIFRRRALAGSLIGGIRETQEMLDFCAEHGIVADIELIPMAAINSAYERMLKSDVKYRFVIDMSTLQA
jgi:alcohol dehydrogenase (NADP+)